MSDPSAEMTPSASPAKYVTKSGAFGWTLLAIGAAIYVIPICVVVWNRAESSSDFRDFWQTALFYRITGQLTAEQGVHNYLPVFTILMTPWSLLPLRVAIVLFTMISLGLFAWTVLEVERLLVGYLPNRPRPAMLAAIGLMLAYVTSCGVVGAVGLVLLFLIVLAWRFCERGDAWQAGVLLGLATLIKILPGVLVVFLLVKRQWRAAGSAILVILVVGLGVPWATLGWNETVRQHRDFYERAVVGGSAYTTIHAEKPLKANFSNNAGPIVLRRLLSHTNGGKGDDADTLFVNVASLSPQAIWWVYIALAVLFLGDSLAVALVGPERWARSANEALDSRRRQFGAWCCLMLLAAPLVWTHYLPLVYVPIALATDRGQRHKETTGRSCWWSVLAMLAWLAGAILLAWPAARASGAQIAAVAVLWVVMVVWAWGPLLDRFRAEPAKM